MAVLMISINKHNRPKMLASVIQDSGPLLCPVDRPMHVTMQSSSKFGVGSHTKIYEQEWYKLIQQEAFLQFPVTLKY